MKFYIGSSLQNREAVSWYAQRLKEHGWEHAYDWTKLEPAAAPERLAEIAQRERQGVRDAEAFAPENTVAFYQLPGVVRLAGTDRENLKRILECAGPLYPSGMPVGE